MSELDKFKRRLVRSVARLLKQDRELQEPAWNQMRKETGCDCKLLWERMRALTIKKMKRLVAAEDRSENIAAVARLSVTDWLLFDLVLAHEKVDVIGRDQIGKGKAQIMDELFELVLSYEIERKTGDQLLEAWAALTREYNSNGRHCSPMLLQKRWYQLKESTRANFYKLWNNYRGNQKLWDVASTYKPSPLQAEIAKKFPYVITQPFPEWEELIEMNQVILLEQFEMQHRMKNRPKTIDDKPDLVVIEPEIETIELGEESDDNSTKNIDEPSTGNIVNLALVKQEPVDDIVFKEEPVEDGLSNVQILDTTHVPPELNEDSNSHLSSLGVDEVNREDLMLQMSNFMKATKTDDSGSKSELQTETPDIEIPDDLIKQKAEEYCRNKSKPIELQEGAETLAAADDKNDDGIVDDIIKQKADDFVRKVDMKKLVNDVVDEFKLPASLAFADDGIELVDDGIEYDEDDEAAEKKIKEEPLVKTEAEEDIDVLKDDVNKEGEDNKEDKNELDIKEAGSPKFDLKLLMEPVVYTTKLDDMIIFKGKRFNFVQLQNVIDSVIVESKPVSSRAIKIEAEEEDDNDGESLGGSVDDTIAGNDDLFKNDINRSHSNQTKDKTDTNKSDAPSDDVSANGSSCHSSNDDSESDGHIDESLRVKTTSYLLQKPRTRTYNSINLCKNPDFNTRLKRLTAGFFSSERNRKLLSACKPMTIDLHKAFDSKLVNGTLYLKSSGETPQQVSEQTDKAQSSSVMPSAMAVQSLLSKEQTNVTIDDLLSSTQIDTVDLTQRSKTINLRDLSEIRRINQHLLTAQVPPMRVESGGQVNNDLIDHSQDIIENVRDDAIKRVSDSDDPNIMGIAGEQNLFLNSSTSEEDLQEDSYMDNKIPTTYQHPVRGRGRGRGRGGRWGTYVPVPHKPIRPSYAPWTMHRSSIPRPPNLDDFLITIDTLNRMINKLDGTDDIKNSFTKKKKKIRGLLPSVSKAVADSSGSEGLPVNDLRDASATYLQASDCPASTAWGIDKSQHDLIANDNSNGNTLLNDAPVTIETDGSALTPDETVTTAVQSKKPSKKVSKKPQTKSSNKKSLQAYCCWAAEKVAKFSTNQRIIKRHRCNFVCRCCCREQMLNIIRERQLYRKRERIIPEILDDYIVLSDEDLNVNSATDDINDVRIPGFDPEEETTPVPNIRVYSSSGSNKVGCSHTNSTCTTACAGRGTPMSVAAVTTTHVTTPVNTQPVLRINVNFMPAPSSDVPAAIPVIPSINTGVELPQTSLLQHIASQISPITATAVQAQARKKPATITQKVSQQTMINTSQRHIVIDASEPSSSTDLPEPSISVAYAQTDDRVLFLNSKSISQKPKESPIFLGKNKILLTTVKFPPNINGDVEAPNPPLQPARVIPALPLPAGVQLVLMPDGQLTYTLDSSVQLDEAQISVLPKILSAVQQQIDISKQGNTSTAETASSHDNSLTASSEICTSNCKDGGHRTVDSVNDEISGDKTVNTAPESNQDVIEISEKANEQDISQISQQTTDLDINNSNNSDIITIEETDDAASTNASNINTDNEINNGASSSRNLLSDLMEMSGISPEDTNLQESVTQIPIPAADSSIPLPITVVRPVETIENPVPNVLPATESVRVNETPNLTELSPITSLAELKYACENDGLFYKLDLDTGLLALINVCIKKNPKPKTRNIPAVAPKSVIDLTDDIDTEPPKNVSKDGTVKPIKLFKRVVYQPPNLIMRKSLTKNVLKDKAEHIRSLLQKTKQRRKQNLAKIEAKIDLVDSDAPMEEEYLVDSSGTEDDVPRNETDSNKRKTHVHSIDTDDSSDEEPLAKKFMRLKQTKTTTSTEKTDETPDSNEKIDDPKDNNDVTDAQEDHDVTKVREDHDVTKAQEDHDVTEAQEEPDVTIDVSVPIGSPKPVELEADKLVDNDNNSNFDEMDIEEPQFLPFLAEENESQEDCILGV